MDFITGINYFEKSRTYRMAQTPCVTSAIFLSLRSAEIEHSCFSKETQVCGFL